MLCPGRHVLPHRVHEAEGLVGVEGDVRVLVHTEDLRVVYRRQLAEIVTHTLFSWAEQQYRHHRQQEWKKTTGTMRLSFHAMFEFDYYPRQKWKKTLGRTKLSKRAMGEFERYMSWKIG